MIIDTTTISQNLHFAESISQVRATDWTEVSNAANTYFSLPYLNALEKGLPYSFYYIQFYDEVNKPIGIAYFQIIPITNNEINTDALSQRMGGLLPNNLLSNLDIRILICGNAFATGENGYYFRDSISAEDQTKFISKAVDEIIVRQKKGGQKVHVTMIKEFWPESFTSSSEYKKAGYCEVNIDVNMVLTLRPEWKNLHDYLGAMNSKFRTKAKQVLKKSEDLITHDFGSELKIERVQDVEELYNSIVDKANFSFGRLNAKTLFLMKDALKEDFFFRGYYLDGKLVGFSTATLLDSALDGNFIGLDYEYNSDYAIYQRMLYDFVEFAISKGTNEVRIGRTAEEIKSGIGAEPIEMKFYAKHRNKMTNAVLRPFIQNLSPSQFNLRRPFKADHYE